ncbi:aminotransferase class V-fold PLP-dependent enzyme [Streptomyces sp. NPDC006553]|uniref:aminotransferase class V-fold PLP-dependent enzyme n=1 Tax=unclassified Streptomyces TaxID=2593676 RepID=UPI00225A2C53|nr:aminotransferase class V-fold PLP-dependent enzyme [Streptomyces sp. NBC_00233]MCX5232415.1 aminotransferase class V-fold PLP-dependent enzyme [Streptomyces sp. NBC_00233]
MNAQITGPSDAATRAAPGRAASDRGPMPGYLDHARVGPLSRRAAAALAAATALAGRADPADLDRLFALGDAARSSAARLLGARPHEIGLAPSTSNGLFTVAAALQGPGTVLVPRGEFPANVYPWLRFAGRGGPDVRLVDPDGQRHITADLLRRRLTPDVTALTVSAVDSLTGHVAPLAALKEILGPDRLLIVDAVQGLGAVPLEADAADVLVSGGQKWLRAGWGAALLLVRDRCGERLAPGLGGWAGVTDPFAVRHPAPSLPGAAAHLATNPDFPAAAAIGAAVDGLLDQGGPAVVGARIRATLAELLDRARHAGAEVLSDGLGPRERGGIGTFRLPGHDPATVHRTLEAAGVIATRRDEWIRLSPHASTPPSAADLFAKALRTLTHGTTSTSTSTSTESSTRTRTDVQEPTCPTS